MPRHRDVLFCIGEALTFLSYRSAWSMSPRTTVAHFIQRVPTITILLSQHRINQKRDTANKKGSKQEKRSRKLWSKFHMLMELGILSGSSHMYGNFICGDWFLLRILSEILRKSWRSCFAADTLTGSYKYCTSKSPKAWVPLELSNRVTTIVSRVTLFGGSRLKIFFSVSPDCM